MQVTVTLYKNTGFNLVDRPQTVSVLDDATTVTLPNINVVQNVGLSFIDVPLTYAETRQIDYIKLVDSTGEVVYYVLTTPPAMLNENTARLNIKEDFLTTLGITQNDFTSGLINAAHVPVDDWKYFTIPESRFQPSGIVTLLQTEMVPVKTGKTKNEKQTFIASTLGLVETAASTEVILNTGKTLLQKAAGLLTNDEYGNVAVTVPLVKPPANDFNTEITLIGMDANGHEVPVIYKSPYYFYRYNTLGTAGSGSRLTQARTLNYIRSLGLMDSIISFYDIDSVYIDTMTDERVGGSRTISQLASGTDVERTDMIEDIELKTMVPIFEVYNAGNDFNFEYDSTIKNKKCFAGNFNQYTIVSKCTGNTYTANAEDLKLSDEDTTATKPTVVMTADLRANGSPKAFFKYINGGANTGLQGVNGMQWANHQTNYMGQYGTDLANNNYRMQMNSINKQAINGMGAAIGQYAGGLMNAAGGIGNVVGGIGYATNNDAMFDLGSSMGATFKSNPAGQLAGAGQMLGAVNSAFNTIAQYDYNKSQADLSNLMSTMATKSPIIEFPYAEGSRDYFGNFFTLYKTRYNSTQLKQLDDFFTLWGYQVGGIEIAGQSENWLSNRQYFNYLSMSNVSIKRTNLSMLEREGLATELSNVRLWKIKPVLWKMAMGNAIVS